MTIGIPANSIVGQWQITAEVDSSGSHKPYHWKHPIGKIYVIFNPWCELDTVFMANEEERCEYVLNDVGMIWMGTYHEPTAIHWIFAQV